MTKTDLVRYLRCPYAFLQVDRGLLDPQALIDPISQELIDDGIKFHENVFATAAPMPDGLELESAFLTDSTLVGLPVLRNQALKLLGAPDGVRAAGGQLVPIEIKSHKDVRRTDLLELAFYWLVLEPYRSMSDFAPRGELWLRRDGDVEVVEVDIEPRHFEDVIKLVGEIRRARRRGVKARVCGCAACQGPLADQVRQLTRDGKDLTMIWGIGRRFASALEQIGISDYDTLIEAPAEAVIAGLRGHRLHVSANQIGQWRQHSIAYREARAMIFGPAVPVGDSFIAIDLEYDPFDPHIWLIGILTSRDGKLRHTAMWADGTDDERRNLLALADLLQQEPDMPVITWGGVMADLPQLQSAVERHALGDSFLGLPDRHVDLFMHAARSLRLPTPTLSLAGVGRYFGIPKMSKITDGFEAQAMFNRYLRSSDQAKRAQLRQALLDYNREDLDTLCGAHHALRTLRDDAD